MSIASAYLRHHNENVDVVERATYSHASTWAKRVTGAACGACDGPFGEKYVRLSRRGHRRFACSPACADVLETELALIGLDGDA